MTEKPEWLLFADEIVRTFGSAKGKEFDFFFFSFRKAVDELEYRGNFYDWKKLLHNRGLRGVHTGPLPTGRIIFGYGPYYRRNIPM